MKDKLIRAALLGAGCIDADVAVKIGDFSGIKLTDAGDVDGDILQATVKALKESKAYLFEPTTTSTAKEPPKSGPEVKSALEMTDKEYKAAKWKMKGEAEQRRRASMAPNFTGKPALEMTDAEYEAARRRGGTSPTYSMTTASARIASLMATRGSRGGETTPSGGAMLLRQRPKPGEHRADPPTWGGLHLRNRSASYQSRASLAPGRS